jgi:short subunit dehydrogenase-like uncharacterized protein
MRTVLFGAAGYTGELTARAMVARGLQPVLAGRNRARLESLAAELGGLPVAVADAEHPATIAACLEPGSVLVTTVGPFLRYGEAAVTAAIDAGAAYVDAAGEPPFVRRVFEVHGPRAERAGVPLLPSFAFDCVPGNLAGALALEEAGPAARRVDVGYFMPGDRRGWQSAGSRASFLAAAIEPSFAWRGAIHGERSAARVRSFTLASRRCTGVSAGTSEHFSLPRLYPQLAEVNVYLGYLDGPARAMQALSLAGAGVLAVPGAHRVARRLTQTLVRRAPGSGPDARSRARTGTAVVAVTYDGQSRLLSEVHLTGANGYAFSAEILAWAAAEAAAGRVRGAGAVGPVEAFGIDALEAGCATAGMTRAAAG